MTKVNVRQTDRKKKPICPRISHYGGIQIKKIPNRGLVHKSIVHKITFLVKKIDGRCLRLIPELFQVDEKQYCELELLSENIALDIELFPNCCSARTASAQ